MLENCQNSFNQAIKLNNQNFHLFYCRGIINLALNKINEAINDLEIANEKSDENYANIYYAKGLAYAIGKCYQQAIQDLSASIKLNSKFVRPLLVRAMCLHLSGNSTSAIIELMNTIQVNPMDQEVFAFTGDLLVSIGANEDALKIYAQLSNSSASSEKILMAKYICYIEIRELNSALEQLEQLLNLTNKECYKVDKMCLNSLKLATKSDNPREFQKLLKTGKKILVKLVKQSDEGYTFKLYDILLYLGVFEFYLQEYQSALKHFYQAFQLKKASLLSQNDSSFSLENINLDNVEDWLISSEAQSENTRYFLEERKNEKLEKEWMNFENNSFNVFEFYFNCILVKLQMNDYSQAILITEKLLEIIPNEYNNELQQFLDILNNGVNSSKLLQQNYSIFNDDELIIFPTNNKLCQIFPTFKLSLKNCKKKCRLSFCMPNIKTEKLKIEFDNNLLRQISIREVDNQAEGPWIRRNSEGIIFTNKLHRFDNLEVQITETQQQIDTISEFNEELNEQDEEIQQIETNIIKCCSDISVKFDSN